MRRADPGEPPGRRRWVARPWPCVPQGSQSQARQAQAKRSECLKKYVLAKHMFSCWKLFSRCSRLHRSAATLTNSAHSAKHESVAGGCELSSHAYSDKICVLGTRGG